MSTKTLDTMETKLHPTGNGRSRLENKVRFESLLEQAANAPVELKPERKLYVLPKGNSDAHRALNAYLNTDTDKARFAHYFIDGHELFYRTVSTVGGTAELIENQIAAKINGTVIGNSSVLPLIGRTVAYGRPRENRGETEVQRLLSGAGILMVPFSVFAQAGLSLSEFKLDDKGPEETITRDFDTGKRDEKTNDPIIETRDVHFTGASLFTIGTSQFLFDIDRGELKHRIFNPFLVKLKTPVETVSEAYESLKPQKVKDAEAAGKTVLRQGEWFFIPTDRNVRNPEASLQRAELRAGRNRPNTCQTALYLNADGTAVPALGTDVHWNDPRRNEHDRAIRAAKTVLFTGTVEHTGREHAPLQLKGFYEAVPNTATESWTIVGDVD